MFSPCRMQQQVLRHYILLLAITIEAFNDGPGLEGLEEPILKSLSCRIVGVSRIAILLFAEGNGSSSDHP